MELGERRRTTSPLRIEKRVERAVAREETERQRAGKEMLWPVAASMRAVVPEWWREEMKAVTERWGVVGRGMGLRLL